MRHLFVILFLICALPAAAQQERECRGKQPFDLGDGAYGCLQKLGLGGITQTRTRDDGASSSTRNTKTGQIEVLMFGTYKGSKQATGQRIRAICNAFLPGLQAAIPNTSYHQIIVVMVWPRIENPGDYVAKDRSKVAVQPGFSNAACRGVRFFG